jgi:hypothetical protein
VFSAGFCQRYFVTIKHAKNELTMSEQPVSTEESTNQASTQRRMPSAEGAEQKGPLPAAADLAIEDIMMVNPRLFSEHR